MRKLKGIKLNKIKWNQSNNSHNGIFPFGVNVVRWIRNHLTENPLNLCCISSNSFISHWIWRSAFFFVPNQNEIRWRINYLSVCTRIYLIFVGITINCMVTHRDRSRIFIHLPGAKNAPHWRMSHWSNFQQKNSWKNKTRNIFNLLHLKFKGFARCKTIVSLHL